MNIPLGASVGAVFVPDMGREYEVLFKMADKALQDTCTASNPRVPSKEDIVKIYTHLWSS